MPHLFVVLVEIISVALILSVLVKRNLNLRIGQFFHHIKHIPPRFRLVGWVFDRLDINAVELLTPMVKALLTSVPSGNRRISTAALVISSVSKLIFRQDQA